MRPLLDLCLTGPRSRLTIEATGERADPAALALFQSSQEVSSLMVEKSLDAVIADLTHETAGWPSLSVWIRMEQTLRAPLDGAPTGSVLRGREEYLTTARGERRYAQLAEVEGREVRIRVGYVQADRCASVRFQQPPFEAQQSSITISKTFLDEASTGRAALPQPLPFFVGLVPIRTAINTAVRLGPSQVAGRDCTRYLFANVATDGTASDLVYHLDAATSYPLKVETFLPGAVAGGTPISVWEADRLDEVQNFHAATDSRYTTFAPTGGGGTTPTLINSYHIDMVLFDRVPPPTEFWPWPDPGVAINNTITGTLAYNTPDGKAPRPITAAIPNALPWMSWALTGGTTVGLALLVVGLVRWIKGGPR